MIDRQANQPLPTRTLSTAKRFRVAMTDAERALWFRLRAGRLDGLKFRRRNPIPPYIVDFYCSDAGLVVEVDGSQHEGDLDEARTIALRSKGLRIVRFWDNQVLTDADAALAEILRFARPVPSSGPSGHLLPEGEGKSVAASGRQS